MNYKFDLTDQETQIVLDALKKLPLEISYVTFSKMLQQANEQAKEQPQEQPDVKDDKQ